MRPRSSVFGDIAQDVRELQRDAEVSGVSTRNLAALVPEDLDRDQADDTGDVVAVRPAAHRRWRSGDFVRSISTPEIRSKKYCRRHAVLRDGVEQRLEHRPVRIAGEAPLERGAVGHQTRRRFRLRQPFVGDVIAGAGEGVGRVDRAALVVREKHEAVVEVLRFAARDLLAVVVRRFEAVLHATPSRSGSGSSPRSASHCPSCGWRCAAAARARRSAGARSRRGRRDRRA